MATLLDIGLLEFLLPVFGMILVYTLVFGVLQKTKFITDKGSINAWIAIAVSVLFMAIPGAMKFIAIITPWFVVMLIIAFSLILIFLFMGVETSTIANAAKDATVRWTIIILGIIIIVIGLTSVFGPLFGTPTSDESGVGREVQRSIFDPKVLTTVFSLIVAGQAVRLISEK